MENRLKNKTSSEKWLTDELKQKVRSLFEPRYNRPLSENEVVSIALNLTQFVEHFYKFKWRLLNENPAK